MIPEINNSSENPEKLSREKIIHGYLLGTMSGEKFMELLEQVHDSPNFYRMAKNKMEHDREQKINKNKELKDRLCFWKKK